MMTTNLPHAVVPDANILYSATLRDIFMWLHHEGLAQVRWTRDIAKEWQINAVADGKMTGVQVAWCDWKMQENCPDWEIAGYEHHESVFPNVHPKDRHVAAAAHGWAMGTRPDGDPDAQAPAQEVALVTWNTKDFDLRGATTLVTRYTPDEYLTQLYSDKPGSLALTLSKARDNLKKPPVTAAEYVQFLVNNKCVGLAALMSAHWGLPPSSQ